MTRITHILCPVDFSESSRHALHYAAGLARQQGARLTVFHAYTTDRTLGLAPLVLDAADRQRLMGMMQRFTESLADVAPVLDVEEAGHAHQAILGLVDALRADLLVIGSHGRSGFERLFLGSVTEKVIRKASCPTMVVPPRAADAAPDAPVQFARILCPVDFSENSTDALARALDMATTSGADVTVLHAIEIPPVVASEPGVSQGSGFDRLGVAAQADARRRLTELIPTALQARCRIETPVVNVRAYHEVLRQAVDDRADLIVMGMQGRGAIERFVFGSTTHHVVRAATCPVLIVRHA